MTLEPERLVDAAEIAARVFSGAVTPRWVREHVPGVRLSQRKILFYESKVRAWLQQRSAA